ncbi:MAG: hypothetical protein JXQ27_14440 [Acidobacteria bacterium]|nr:hypothetical protein [Acidobacteriota bacterium]
MMDDERLMSPKVFAQAAAIPFRRTAGGVDGLLVTTRSGRWVPPKGVVEAGRTPGRTAASGRGPGDLDALLALAATNGLNNGPGGR